MQRDSVVPAGTLGVSLACSLNTMLYVVGRSLRGDFVVLLPWEMAAREVGVVDVLAMTAAACVVGILMFLLLETLFPQRAWVVWCVVVLLAFTASLVPYVMSYLASTSTRFWLTLMHSVPVFSLYGSLRAARH